MYPDKSLIFYSDLHTLNLILNVQCRILKVPVVIDRNWFSKWNKVTKIITFRDNKFHPSFRARYTKLQNYDPVILFVIRCQV
jgi:hypothetical protein